MGDEQLELLRRIAGAVGVTPDGSVTVSRILTLYSESREFRELKAVATERGRVNHVVRILGKENASTLAARDMDRLRTALKHLAPATRNRVVVRLTAALRWAVDRGHLSRYPLGRTKLETENNERSTHRTEEDLRAIVASLQSRGQHVIAAMTVTARDGMLRRGEVCYLRQSQLDHRGGTILLYAKETKGKRDRVTPLSEWASELVRALPRSITSPYAFVSKRGRPYNPRTVLRVYQRACDEAGVKAAPGERCWFHDERAGGVDQQLEIGMPVERIMAMGGWKDHRVFRRYVRKPAKDIAREAAAKLNAKRAEATERLVAARRSPHRAPTEKQEKSAKVDLFS